MDIVILHCHFERGGVTQVVENHVRAIATSTEVGRIFLVSDRRIGGLSPETKRLTEQILLDGFDYDPEDLPRGSAAQRSATLTDQLERQLARVAIAPGATVLHWHNHSLGKNTAAPAMVRRLAASGWRLLLQVHDFPEDNRPENYAELIAASSATSPRQLDGYLYPVASQIHYATLTAGDAGVLVEAGVPAERAHCLPNSVTLPSGHAPSREQALAKIRDVMSLASDARWCLYPVRGIRRKNVGEFLLLCRWLPENVFGGLTLRPTTPLEARSYDRWRRIASLVSPRAVFDAAHHQGVAYADNLAACDFVLSTSVAEGFGMAFLEPWLADRPVIARRLPSVTQDFASSGLEMPAFYTGVPVPGDRPWLEGCRRRISASFRDAWTAVPAAFRPPAELVDADEGETIDFGRLTPRDQSDVLRRATESPGFEAEMRSLSAALIRSFHQPPDERVIGHNAKVVASHYSTESQWRQLHRIYRQLLQVDLDPSPSDPCGDAPAVELVSRLRPFYPCRTETRIDDPS